MKQIFVTLFSLTLFLSANGQNKNVMTKTVDENYGKATYSYYQNENFQDIPHGPFTFVRNNTNGTGKFIANISGRYKNGLRDGIWIYKMSENFLAEYGRNVGVYRTRNMAATVTYKNDMACGSFYYSYNMQEQTKYSNGKVTTKELVNESVSTTLSDEPTQENSLRQPINKFTIKYTGGTPITYILNSEGFAIGCTISKESGPFKNVYVIDNSGILDKYVSIRQYTTSHNDVVESYTLSSEDKAIFKNFQVNKDSLLLTDNRIDCQIGNISINGLYTNLFNQEYFEAFKFVIKYYDVKKIEYIPYKTNPKWSNINRYSSIEGKIQASEEFLNTQGKYTSTEDQFEIKTIIDSLSKCLEKEKYISDCKKQYEELYLQIEKLTNIPELKSDRVIELKIRGVDFYTIKDQAYNLFSYPKKLFFHYKYKPLNFTVFGYSENPPKSYTPVSSYYQDNSFEDRETSLYKIKEYINFLELKNQHKDSIIQVNKLICNIYENLDKLEELYVSISYPGRLLGKAEVDITKPKIYNPFYEIMQDLSKQIKSADSFESFFNYAKQINDLCVFVTSIYNSKTKNLEKELKIAKSPPEQYEIFQNYMNRSESKE